jgi:hypothetical protein
MQSVVNSLAALAFVGMVLLLFAASALLKLVRDLQAALTELRLGTPPVLDRMHLYVPALADGSGADTYLLVVDDGCPACAERARRLVEIAASGGPGRVVAASADERCGAWFAGSLVDFRLDAGLVGHIGVSVTPMLVKYDGGGHEQWRRVVASDQDLDRLMDLTDGASSLIMAGTDHGSHSGGGR